MVDGGLGEAGGRLESKAETTGIDEERGRKLARYRLYT